VSPTLFDNYIFVTVFNQNAEQGIHDVKIFNLSAQFVKRKQYTALPAPSQTIIFTELNDLANGIYFIQYTFNNNTYHSKIVKQTFN